MSWSSLMTKAALQPGLGYSLETCMSIKAALYANRYLLLNPILVSLTSLVVPTGIQYHGSNMEDGSAKSAFNTITSFHIANGSAPKRAFNTSGFIQHLVVPEGMNTKALQQWRAFNTGCDICHGLYANYSLGDGSKEWHLLRIAGPHLHRIPRCLHR